MLNEYALFPRSLVCENLALARSVLQALMGKPLDTPGHGRSKIGTVVPIRGRAQRGWKRTHERRLLTLVSIEHPDPPGVRCVVVV